jgi:hypothetical protein
MTSLSEQLREALGTDQEVIKLTDEDRARIAQERAEVLVKYNEKINAPISYKQYTADEVYELIEANPRFKIDAYNRRVIKLLCLYFTKDVRFEENGGDLKKGILLFGPTGVGKTMLMEFFRRNENHCFGIKPCTEIADEYATHSEGNKARGREVIPMYGKNRTIVASPVSFGQSASGYCFDDLGQEPETKHYGDSARVMAPIIEARYRLGKFNSTHMTTNLTAALIGDTYGERVRSRCAEMFNLITFPENAPDRRRTKIQEDAKDGAAT